MNYLLGLLHISIVVLSAACLGRWSLRGLRLDRAHIAFWFAYETLVGLAIVSHVILLLAWLHWLTLPVLWGLLAALSIPAIWEGGVLARRFSRLEISIGRVEKTALVTASIYLAWVLLVAALPPVARDSLLYHLAVPKSLLENGGLVSFADNICAYYPQFTEMLLTFALGTAGEYAAKLYHPLAGMLCALALYGFSRKYLSRHYALLAVLLLLTIPSVIVVMTWAYVDLFFAAAIFLGVAIWIEFLQSERLPTAILAGALLGIAIATKYTGLQILALLVVLVAAVQLEKRSPRAWLGTAALVGIAVTVASPYLLRNLAETGSPIFPFPWPFDSLSTNLNWDDTRANLLLQLHENYGLPFEGKRFWHPLLAPVLAFLRGRFNDPEAYDGVLSPIFLLTPLLLWRVKKIAEIKYWLIFTVLFFFFWTVTTKQIRFLFPVLPVLAFLLSFSLFHLNRQMITGCLVAMALLVSVQGFGEVYKLNPLPFWAGRQARDTYLAHRLSNYEIYQDANKALGPGDRLFLMNMRNYGYYLDVAWTGDFIFEQYRIERLLSTEPSIDGLQRFFLAESVTHLLVDTRFIQTTQSGLSEPGLQAFVGFLQNHSQLLSSRGPYRLYQLHLS